jgi:hypothetical protein
LKKAVCAHGSNSSTYLELERLHNTPVRVL